MRDQSNSFFSRAFWDSLLFTQNKYHQHGVLMHTLHVVWEVVKAGRFSMLAAAFLHDIGKPFVAYKKDEEDYLFDEWSFTDHEEKSYRIIQKWPFISDYTKKLVRYHYLIRDLKKSQSEDPKRYKQKKGIWDQLDHALQADLAEFLHYDDLGKGKRRRD